MRNEAGLTPRKEDALPLPQLDFESVYRQCFPGVWKTLARLGVPSAQLDDVAQEVFILVHRKLAELKDPSRLRAWTTSFAVRVASDVRRHHRRRGQSEEVPETLVAPTTTDGLTEQRQGLEVLQSVLGRLSDELREVFVLVELDELSGPEVAEALGLNLNTVYSRLRLARAAFNELIEQFQEAP
ncbi:MAG: RNA polymerase sigma factor [Myxococcota bacterium]